MSTYVDITGIDPAFKVTDQRTVIYTVLNKNLTYTFARPAFFDSVIVYRANVLPMTELQRGIDWTVLDSDIDLEASMFAKLSDDTFDKVLLKSITILNKPENPFQISINYNALFISRIDLCASDAENVDLSPELIQEMSSSIAYLRNIRNPIDTLVSQATTMGSTLDPDITGLKPENLISGEVHHMDASNGILYIKPSCGSFYKAGLTIRLNSDNSYLTESQYRCIGLNVAKTAQSTNTSGVYDVIFITAPVVGDVTISYQAFGGDVTRGDVDRIYNLMLNVIAHINNSTYLTEDTVGGSTSVLQLINRLSTLEENMRILSTGGTPNYADKTSGKAFLHKLQSPDGITKNWYTIAKLYTVSGSTTVYSKNQGKWKIQCALAELMFEVSVSADINNTVSPLVVDTISCNDNMRFIPYNNYADVNNRIYPEFRLVWNTEVGIQSGAYLQIGFNLKNIAIETMGIEDISGYESCWLTITPSTLAAPPTNDLFLLPDGVSVWSTANPVSKSSVATYNPKYGYLAWGGSVNLNTCSTSTTLNGIATPVDIKIGNISKVEFHIYNRVTGTFVLADAKVIYSNGRITGSTFFDTNDMCAISFNMIQVSNVFNMSITASLGNYSEDANTFELREIRFKF